MPLDHSEFVMFDIAGTTVDDRFMGPSLVVTAFVEAFAGAGFTIAPEQVHQHRGKEKRETIHSLLRELTCKQPRPEFSLRDVCPSSATSSPPGRG
jgi:beta-phosphoglucomutase-like phosphatase (HAD superfamily)